MPKTSPIPSARRKRKPRESVVLRDLSIREANTLQVTFSKFESDFWKLYWTRAGNFVMPTQEAARYVMVRLHDTSLRLQGSDDPNSKAALLLADKISVNLL